MRAPATLDDVFAADVQRLCAFQPEGGYVKTLRDSFADAKLLSACVRAMVASGERYVDGDLLFSRIQYLYGKTSRELGRPD